MTSSGKIIVGLGNPGSSYRYNRHNAGYLMLEAFYQESGIIFGKIKKVRTAFLVEGVFDGIDFVMVQPRVYMNSSGAVFTSTGLVKETDNSEILVLHDDISFELGRIKLKQNGGDGGHKGIRSIIETLGTNEFSRIKIGILNPESTIFDLSGYVLENFTQEEFEILSSVFPEVIEAIKIWLTDGIEVSMNRFNTRKELQVNNG